LDLLLPIALAGGSWVILLVMLLILAGVIYGFYTREGSAIDEHPGGAESEAPGAEGKSEVSGKDEGEGSALDTHGTR
jgi:hypothetical protein